MPLEDLELDGVVQHNVKKVYELYFDSFHPVVCNNSINQIAVQQNYLLKQIYNICGGNKFRLLSASHHQALHNFQTRI
jgi:hypothetical protein